MKLDLTRLPVLEAIIGFLVIMLIVTFVGAFAATDGGGGSEAVSESPTSEATPADGTPEPGGATQVTMRDNSFDPEDLTVQAGSTASFEITNDGSAIHNMHIAGPDGDFTEDFCAGGPAGDPCSDPTRVRGGESATLTWPVPPNPGEVDFRCDYHPTEMTGTITIE